MRLPLGSRIDCSDRDDVGVLGDVVVDPESRRVTHVIVRAKHGTEPARLVPLELVSPPEGGRALSLGCTAAELAELEPTQDFALLTLGEHPSPDGGWEVGVEDDVPIPSYAVSSLGDYVGDLDTTIGVAYDRIPRGTVELRRTSIVEAPDGSTAGELRELVVEGGAVTELVFEHGHLWWRRREAVPVARVAEIANDAVVLRDDPRS